MIKVLVVDDSASGRELLTYIINSSPEMRVTAVAVNGREAVQIVQNQNFDAVTMDIHMPVMDGIEAITSIMSSNPVPIIIVSESAGAKEGSRVLEAMSAGALAVMRRPAGPGSAEHAEQARELIQAIKTFSEVKLVKRWRPEKYAYGAATQPQPLPAPRTAGKPKIIAIGSSTGGPEALQIILSKIDIDTSVPVFIVQHISRGFSQGLADWIGTFSKLPARLARDGEQAAAGRVYVAPAGFNMGVDSRLRISVVEIPAEINCHSIGYFFNSVLESFGRDCVAVLLTGMGRDGARELKNIKDAGGLTIAQDEKSSVVWGMPGEAVKIGGASYVMPPADIPGFLAGILGSKE